MNLLKIVLLTSFFGVTLTQNSSLLNSQIQSAIHLFKQKFSQTFCYQGAPIFKYNKDQDRNTCELIQARGFPCEIHYVTTYEGYIIQMHRIRPQPVDSASTKQKPVILQTGLIGTSADFIMASDVVFRNATIGQDMGIELAKQGYDVWLSNNRGNQYGINHTTLSPNDKKFWDFSWQDMSEFDTPAIIEFVLNQTGKEQVHFVGHSQGSAVMFALLSTTNKFNEAVSSFTAISPITRIGHAKTTFRYLIEAIQPYLWLGGEVFGKNLVTSSLVPLACDFAPSREICNLVFFSITGPDCSQLEKKRMAVYLAHMPTSTSAKNLLHFHQLFKSNKFQKYDYKSDNEKVYGQAQVPEYDLKNITHPAVHVIYSHNDWFVPLDGVEDLKADLTKAQEFYEIGNPNSNHIDPLVGMDIAVEVNKKVMEILDKHN